MGWRHNHTAKGEGEMKVAFLGLGAMGFPMAGHLKKAGLDVCVYNRTRKRAEQWVDKFSGRHGNPVEAVDLM